MSEISAQSHRFNEGRHAFAPASYILVHFFLVPCKTTTSNNNIYRLGGEHEHLTVTFHVSILTLKPYKFHGSSGQSSHIRPTLDKLKTLKQLQSSLK